MSLNTFAFTTFFCHSPFSISLPPAPTDNMASTSTSTATPIPPQLLSHPALQDHPTVLALHETHGGIPANPDAETLDSVLQFANSVASTAVAPGTKTRRTDPSPRRTARVWRSQLLGHRDPSVSPEHSPVRYRSRSRPPGTATVPEDGLAAVSVDDRREVGAGTGLRAPGKRDMASVGGNGASDLENRVAASIQQQHEFHDRLLQRFVAVEAQATQDHTALQARFDQSEAR